jgi:CheY-like chemotaxis protein
MLVVEDGQGDAAFLKEAVEASNTPVSLHVVAHGEEGLQYLRRQGQYADAPRPDVVVLDLNLPRMSGREMLAEMMREPSIRDIPVAVLTSSSSERSVCKLCPPGQCLYFTKTDDFDELQRIVRAIARHAQRK